MHIFKRLTFEVDLRKCAVIVIQKSGMENKATQQVYLALFKFIQTGVCAVSEKYHKLATAFCEDGCIPGRRQR